MLARRVHCNNFVERSYHAYAESARGVAFHLRLLGSC